MSRTLAPRRGVTLVELLIALVLFSLIMVGTFGVLRNQIIGFTAGSDRMNLLQNFRYAANVLEKDLRTAGSGVPSKQPFLVYAGADLVAFSANYTTNTPNDVFAIYSDTMAPDSLVRALKPAQRFMFPGTTFLYPDTSYSGGSGTNSPAETILFFFVVDSTTAREDDYVLRRKVNDAPPEIVARSLLHTGEEQFFEYVRLFTTPGGQSWIDTIPSATLPFAHSAEIHGSVADTGGLAVIDSIRAVRVSFTATNGMTGEGERTSAVSRLIRLPNAGLAAPRTCGDEPMLGTTLGTETVAIPQTPGALAVQLRWDPAIDDGQGERDVVRYVLWRRTASQTEWGDPFMSTPSGEASYLYEDRGVVAGTTYVYAVAAQDCTPSLSDLVTSQPVTP